MDKNENAVCPAYSLLNSETIYPEELNDEYDLKVIAYEHGHDMKIISASTAREWINNTGETIDKETGEKYMTGYGKRCLPLMAANSLGWQILANQRYEAVWNGGHGTEDVVITCDNQESRMLSSHFGSGTVTWHIGYIFYTTKGNFLYCKGPTNTFKDGIQPCEGIIETDWLPFTFTMNWKFTRPNEKIVFERGEPICQLFPYPKEYIEHFTPVIRTKESIPPELNKLVQYWGHSRDTFNDSPKRNPEDWEGIYFKGKIHDDTTSEDLGRKHYTIVKTPKFKTQSSNQSFEVDE